MCRLNTGLLCALVFSFSASLAGAQDTGTGSTDQNASEAQELLANLNELLQTLQSEALLSQEDLTKLKAELEALSKQLEEALKQLTECQTEIQKLSDSLIYAQKLLDDCKKLLAQRESELEAWRTAALVAGAIAILAIFANFIPR